MTEEASPKYGTGIRRRVAVIARFVGRIPAVRLFQGVMSGADQAGGPLMAAGLAFHALFAILPALVFLTGVSGWIIDDPVRRSALIRDVIERVPPLAGVAESALEDLVRGRGAFSLIGAVGLLWGASSFYGSLDEAMARLLPGGRLRNIIERRIRGVLTVLALVATVFGGVILGGIWSVLEGSLGASVGQLTFWRLVGPTLTVFLMVVVVLLTYRFVPVAAPSVRAAVVPAVVTGLAIGVLTLLFTVIAPRLVGGLAAFGALVAVFAALIWLNFVFQLLIWGAAWTRLRRDAETAGRADSALAATAPAAEPRAR